MRQTVRKLHERRNNSKRKSQSRNLTNKRRNKLSKNQRRLLFTHMHQDTTCTDLLCTRHMMWTIISSTDGVAMNGTTSDTDGATMMTTMDGDTTMTTMGMTTTNTDGTTANTDGTTANMVMAMV